MIMHDTNNISRGHSAVSSTTTSGSGMASDVKNPSHLLMDSKWLNVSIIHDPIISHDYTMDEYQSHGPPQKRKNMWLW